MFTSLVEGVAVEEEGEEEAGEQQQVHLGLLLASLL
jgi:hypothetical protein